MKIVRVISGKAGLPVGATYVPSSEDEFNYWFDELGSVESPVKSATPYKREWFEVVQDVALVESTLNQHSEGIAANAKAASTANTAAKKAQETADKALEATTQMKGMAYFDSFVWTEDTEYQYKDIFKMMGYQNIMPLNGYVLLWTRQDPTAKTLSNKVNPTDTQFGISKSTWDESILVNMADPTKPTVRVITVGTGDGKITVFIDSIEVSDAVQE